MLNRIQEAFIGCESTYEEAGIVLFGAPFDSTTSFRPGTRFGPRAIRTESFGIETYSPYSNRDLEELFIYDHGDLELCIGDSQIALKQIQNCAGQIFRDSKIPVMLGGEHLVTLGVVREAVKKYPDLHIIHFDAHADLRDDYLEASLSHATVMRRAWDILGDGRIYQFGIRSGDKSEFEWAKIHTFLNKFNFNGLCEVVNGLKGKPVYFTLDLDIVDPSAFPGTGTPEAGGVGFNELLEAVKIISELDIIGLDIVELSPIYDQSGISTAFACKILREILLLLF